MSLFRDKQIRGYFIFQLLFALLVFGAGLVLGMCQINGAKAMYLGHDEAVASSLLEQGVSREVIATSLTNTRISKAGQDLLTVVGIGEQTNNSMLPFLYQYQKSVFFTLTMIAMLLCLVLICGTFLFFWKRQKLYEQTQEALDHYINGEYTCHLPQNKEGAIYQMFASVEQLATMLQSRNEAENKAKDFLKRTISDISHQLKTPLAALNMYQEIIAGEPDNGETVREFCAKIGVSLKRMEQLIQSMLKITRLDTGNIVFEKGLYNVTELIALSVNELTLRAQNEGKQIVISGNPDQRIVCDLEWTGEALGNIVKNALDHTNSGGRIRITWECTPTMLRILISDNGHGISPQDIHHIFKRFYRSKYALDTQGIGLGLSLAKAIIEGQGGMISVRSEQDEGTTFTLSFLTES